MLLLRHDERILEGSCANLKSPTVFQATLDKAEHTPEERLAKYPRPLCAGARLCTRLQDLRQDHRAGELPPASVQNDPARYAPGDRFICPLRAHLTLHFLGCLHSVDLGGHAGGEKYLYHGICFKFATDWKSLYQGDQYAAKSAGMFLHMHFDSRTRPNHSFPGHELKSLMRFYGLVPSLCVPLMSLIDFRGFRLVAMSILPIGRFLRKLL